MDRKRVAAAMRQAGLSVEDSPNVLVGRSGSAVVYGMLARRGWRLQNDRRYPTRQALVRKPEQVSAFCASVVGPVREEAPCFFDGEMVIRLDQVGGVA